MKTITEWDRNARKFKTYTITASGTIIKPLGEPLGDINTPLSVQRKARKNAVCAMLYASAAVLFVLSAPSLAGADIVEDKLNDLIARVEKAASDAAATAGQQVGTAIVITGREMTQAINQFRSAYEKMLTKTLDELDEKTAKKLHELETIVEKFETRAVSAMEEATKSAQ